MRSGGSTTLARSQPTRPRRTRLAVLIAVPVLALVVIAARESAGGSETNSTRYRSQPPASPIEPSRESAVRVAVGALYALTIPALTDRRRFEAEVTRLSAPGAEAHVAEVFGAADPATVETFRRRPHILRGAPLGYRVERYSRTTASVAIWSVAIAGAPGDVPQSQWRTLVIDLAWTPDGWRVTNGAGVDGPAPSTRLRDLVAEAATFRSFDYVP